MSQVTILNGDCREVLKTLPADSIQCCVTSPPYWGLRDYGTAQWHGGDAECDHRHETHHQKQGDSSQRKGRQNVEAQRNENFKGDCQKCGAIRIDRQIGLESTPGEYVENIVEVFREVRRVLRADGTCWINLGDTYAASRSYEVDSGRVKPPEGLKPKDIVGIPWMAAFALRADGWYLRQDIIWSKPNPMPESVTDRCTKAHEYIFLLSKSERYFYDDVAIQEEKECWRARGKGRSKHNQDRNDNLDMAHFANDDLERGVRNKRSVWTVPTFPFSEAHFATYPPELIRPCILAGTKPGDTVLDPFGGSGTTGMVARELGRESTLIELNEQYLPLIHRRTDTTPGLGI